jgi:hypothetical protein
MMIPWLVALSFLFSFLEAKEMPEKSKKHNLSICAIFKNEDEYLKEWIEYHRLVGVDHFYLYNNLSTDSFRRILDPYVRKGIVTLVYWPDFIRDLFPDQKPFIWSLSTQVSAYENAIKILAPKKTKWLVLLDVDEFLVPSVGNLPEILKKYDSYPGILLPTGYFDSSKNVLPKKNLVIETTTLTQPPRENRQREPTKMIFKPELCTTFTWPPYRCNFKENQQPVAIEESDDQNGPIERAEIKINRYMYRGAIHPEKPVLHIDSRTLSDKEISKVLDDNYAIDDRERFIYRYLPPLKKNLGIE